MHPPADRIPDPWRGGRLLALLVLLPRSLDKLLQRLLHVRSFGVLNGIDLHLFQDGHGLVDEVDDVQHPVDVFLRVGYEEGVRALEVLDLTVRALKALDCLLGFFRRDVLGRDNLPDDLALLGVLAGGGDLQEGLNALLTDRLEGHDQSEPLAHGNQADAVELELLFNGLQVLFVRPALLVGGAQAHRNLRDVGRSQERAVGNLGVNLQEDFRGRIVEFQLHAPILPALRLRELLRHLGGRGGGIRRSVRRSCRAVSAEGGRASLRQERGGDQAPQGEQGELSKTCIHG